MVQLSSSTHVEPSTSTPNPVRVIPGPAGIVQQAKLLKERDILLGCLGVGPVCGAWVSATNYVNAFGGTVTGCLGDIDNFLKKEKLEQVVAIVKSCSPHMLGDLNVTLKDNISTIPGTIHTKSLSGRLTLCQKTSCITKSSEEMEAQRLYILVKERYSSSKPEGYDLMLWGDLHTLFEPDEESEIWMNQNEYNLISWSLCDFCGVHILLMQNGIAIHMLTEKKYPLSQEMISKMLSKRLEVDQESTQAYELLKFIRSQVKK
ncbi:putative reverse transcriptase domain-containing protein [Tanacetum coccineum]